MVDDLQYRKISNKSRKHSQWQSSSGTLSPIKKGRYIPKFHIWAAIYIMRNNIESMLQTN